MGDGAYITDVSDDRGADPGAIYRWQGGVDAQLNEAHRRLDTINGDIRAMRLALEAQGQASSEIAASVALEQGKFRAELAVLRTKVAFWSALGGLIGAGVVSAIVAILTATP